MRAHATAGRSTVAQLATQQCSAQATSGSRGCSEVFPDKNVWLAVLFSMFLHGSILHVLGNMLFLWVFGNNVEDRLGPIPYLLFYLLAGVAATAAHVAFNAGSTVPTIGASGAIAGVMGAYIVWWPHARVLSLIPILFFFGFIELPAAVVLGVWFVTQFFTNPNEGIAWLAHVGGFTFGAAVAFALRGCCRRARWVRRVAPDLGRSCRTGRRRLGSRLRRRLPRPPVVRRRSGVRVRGDEMRRELARGRRPRTRAADRAPAPPRRGAGDARQHERERPAERGGERAVGRRPVADHHARAPKRSRTSADRRGFGLARDLGRPARRGRDRRDERAGTGHEAAGDRIGRRRGWSRRSGRRPAPRRRHGSSRSKSNSRCQPTTTASAGARSTHDVTGRAQRLDHARAGAREHRAPGAGARGSEDRGRGLRARSRRRRRAASTPTRCSFAT